MTFEWDLSKELDNITRPSAFLEALNGASLGESMREPKLKSLKRNQQETDAIKKGLKKNAGAVKITINIDADSLSDLRKMAEKTGVPYQRLLNTLLRKALSRERDEESRLDRLEREIERLKKLVA